MIEDRVTGRFKGIAYVEFEDMDTCVRAYAMKGQPLNGQPLALMPTMAERNRAALMAAKPKPVVTAPTKVNLFNLCAAVNEDMLNALFSPLGKLKQIFIAKDGSSTGFVTFVEPEAAQKAFVTINGLTLGDRKLTLELAHETGLTALSNINNSANALSQLDREETDKTGVKMTAAQRSALMQSLMSSHGIAAPTIAAPAVPVTTRTISLANVFDPSSETEPDWDEDLRADILEECSKYGGVVHVAVDKRDPKGVVYLKYQSQAAATLGRTAMHGRFFGGKQIVAQFVPEETYHARYPDAARAAAVLKPN